MSSNVLHLRRPRTYTTAEEMIDSVREAMFASGLTHKHIATGAKVSVSTVYNLMSGKTKWPKPTTLFPVMQVIGMSITVHFTRVKHEKAATVSD